MALSRVSETWKDADTGITAVVSVDGRLTIRASNGNQNFVFVNSKKEVVQKVAEALLALSAKGRVVKKKNMTA